MRFPTHYAEIRRLAYETDDPVKLKAILLHIADQVEASQNGEMCTYCQLAEGLRRIQLRLPTGSCVVVEK